MRNVCTSGHLFVRGGEKLAGRLPVIAAVQPAGPIHCGIAGFSSRLYCEAAADVMSLLSTPSAADLGLHATDAAAPGAVGLIVRSTTSSFTKMGVTLNSPRKSNAWKRRSSM